MMEILNVLCLLNPFPNVFPWSTVFKFLTIVILLEVIVVRVLAHMTVSKLLTVLNNIEIQTIVTELQRLLAAGFVATGLFVVDASKAS